MSTEKPDTGDADVFDIERVRQLIELMKEHELTEVDLRNSDRRIRLRSGQETTWMAPPAMAAPPAAAAAAPAAAADAGSAAGGGDDDNATFIKSPMVGTFYTSSKPGEPAFIKVGDHVQADTIVCIVEAMKMFNEIPAGVAGKIVSLMVKNEEPVDVGRPLFKVIPD